MKSELEIDGISVEVVRKKMKNLRLVVKPPYGDVRVSVPNRATQKDIKAFVSSNIGWIRSQQDNIASRDYPPPPKYLTGDVFNVWGKPKTLKIIEGQTQSVTLERDNILMCFPAMPGVAQREALLDNFYRQEILLQAPDLFHRHEPNMGVHCQEWRIKKMKTRWGSCNIGARRVWLNLLLARYPIQCLEYVIVHELTHLLERNHTRRFWSLVETFYPDWREAKHLLEQG